MCTQNQFTVQMFMKPVYSTDVHTEPLTYTNYTVFNLHNYYKIGKVDN